jgi:hypothetical protein
MAFLYAALGDVLLRPVPLSQRIQAIGRLPELHNGRRRRQVEAFCDSRPAVSRRLGLATPDG